MTRPRVFVTRILPDKGMARIHDLADAEVWQEEEPAPYEVLLEKVEGMDGLVCLLTDRVDAEVIGRGGETLRVISQMAVGVDNIDIAAATERGIPVGNTPGILTETTADLAFALLMAAARRIGEAERYVRTGRWKTWGPTLLMGQDVCGATLGIIGFGRIGQAVCRRARGFNMSVLFYDPFVDPVAARDLGATSCSLQELLGRADFVTVHTPLTEDTYHLIDEREFQLMKPTSVLINTARGPIVDTQALYSALKDGGIGYAALDVTDPEPIPPDDPLLTLDNCLLVPHIGSSSYATRTRMALMAAENLEAGLERKVLPHCANPEVYG
jgi:glyoxylate reductase